MSRLTKSLANITKKLRWPDNKSVGYSAPESSGQKYLNPLLTPPPRSPRTPEDFMHPEKLGHWQSLGNDYTHPKADRYEYNEMGFMFVTFTLLTFWFWTYCPDLKLHEWARREAFLRTHKREAMGLPLVDRNVVDPERIVLPTEEEIQDFPVTM